MAKRLTTAGRKALLSIRDASGDPYRAEMANNLVEEGLAVKDGMTWKITQAGRQALLSEEGSALS